MATLTAAPAPAASGVLAARYARAFDIAVIVVVAAWQVAGAGSQLVGDLRDYSSAAFQVAAWVVLAAATAVGAVRLLRGRPDAGAAGARGVAWALCGVAVVTSTAVAAACPPGRMLGTDWGWGAAGWVCVLVLLRRPLAELAGFLALTALGTLAVLVHDDPHRVALAGFIAVFFGSTGIQAAVAVAARALNVTARQATDAAAREGRADADREIAGRLHAARRSRWAAVPETIEPLLDGLAAGLADPADHAVRQRGAVEAARLRRLFAESDGSPNPLVHELHACADIAQRRGIAVDIESIGAVPELPPPIRRAITDLAIAALTAAASQARLTVCGTGDGVAVSLVTDAPTGPAISVYSPGIDVASQRDPDNLWLEARWTPP